MNKSFKITCMNLETQHKLGGIWERIENAYGELEGFICGCGHQDQAAANYFIARTVDEKCRVAKRNS